MPRLLPLITGPTVPTRTATGAERVEAAARPVARAGKRAAKVEKEAAALEPEAAVEAKAPGAEKPVM